MVSPFAFHTVQKIVFEPGSSQSLAATVGTLLGERTVFVTDPGLMKLGLADGSISALKKAGLDVTVFSEVEADPSLATIEKAVAAAKASNATSVVGFGGGSSLDVAKLVALLVGSGEDLDDAWGVGNAKGPRLPLVL
ncbi:MAG: iron-containing alcohol dehydrogenase, partial [Pseudomonadota bacterium]